VILGSGQPDLESPQVDLFQLDRAGGHGDLAGLGIKLDLIELAVQGQQLAEDVRLAGQGRLEALLAQGGDQLGSAVLEPLGLPEQLLGQPPHGAVPPVSSCPLDLANQPPHLRPGPLVQGRRHFTETPLGDLLHCGAGHSQGGLVDRVHGIPRRDKGKKTRGTYQVTIGLADRPRA